MITLSHISKEYPLDGTIFNALNNINLTVKKSELIAIVGPSGCGKSTLMHIIGLLDRPSQGMVIINNENTADLNDNQRSRLRNEFAGFIFQQFNLINKLNVKENILLPIIYNRRRLDFDPDKRAEELMERFEIDSKARSYPNKLSGGQQQRVAIARALINKPQLILADEPTGNLDSRTGEKILNLLIELNKKDKITIIMVTHDMNIAKSASRQIKMLDGKIVS